MQAQTQSATDPSAALQRDANVAPRMARPEPGVSDSRPRKGPAAQNDTGAGAMVGDRAPVINRRLVPLFLAANAVELAPVSLHSW